MTLLEEIYRTPIGDHVVIHDIEGDSLYQIAHKTKKYIYLCRQFCLTELMSHADALEYLNNDFLDEFGISDTDLIPRDGCYIFMPREYEVFGNILYSKGNIGKTIQENNGKCSELKKVV